MLCSPQAPTEGIFGKMRTSASVSVHWSHWPFLFDNIWKSSTLRDVLDTCGNLLPPAFCCIPYVHRRVITVFTQCTYMPLSLSPYLNSFNPAFLSVASLTNSILRKQGKQIVRIPRFMKTASFLSCYLRCFYSLLPSARVSAHLLHLRKYPVCAGAKHATPTSVSNMVVPPHNTRPCNRVLSLSFSSSVLCSPAGFT